MNFKLKKITHRKPNFKFEKGIPRYWLKNSAFKSHLLNSFTLIFPTGEKFFIRSISKVFSQIKDPVLKEAAKGFIKQETQHYVEHEKFFQNLRDQGYIFETILFKIDQFIQHKLEKTNPVHFNLALTAGLEHITALLAEISLKENFLDGAHPVMKDLFDWHAAEEIEHRSVAFDIYQEISGNYPLRVFGLVYAYILLGILSAYFTTSLLKQDNGLLKSETIEDFLETFFTKEKLFFKAVLIFIRYMAPDFHPESESHLDTLASNILKNPFKTATAS